MPRCLASWISFLSVKSAWDLKEDLTCTQFRGRSTSPKHCVSDFEGLVIRVKQSHSAPSSPTALSACFDGKTASLPAARRHDTVSQQKRGQLMYPLCLVSELSHTQVARSAGLLRCSALSVHLTANPVQKVWSASSIR